MGWELRWQEGAHLHKVAHPHHPGNRLQQWRRQPDESERNLMAWALTASAGGSRALCVLSGYNDNTRTVPAARQAGWALQQVRTQTVTVTQTVQTFYLTVDAMRQV